MNECLTENRLSTKGRKSDKLRAIIADVLRSNNNDEVEWEIAGQQEIGDEDERIEVCDEDTALTEIGSDASEEKIAIGECLDNNEDQDGLTMVVKTRYGRDSIQLNSVQFNSMMLRSGLCTSSDNQSNKDRCEFKRYLHN